MPDLTTRREIRGETINLTTTDATTTTIWQFTAPDEAVTSVRAVVEAFRPTGGTTFIWEARATYTRDGAGAATLLQYHVLVHQRSVSTWSAAFSTSTNDILIRVTGVAANTIGWLCDATAHVYQP